MISGQKKHFFHLPLNGISSEITPLQATMLTSAANNNHDVVSAYSDQTRNLNATMQDYLVGPAAAGAIVVQIPAGDLHKANKIIAAIHAGENLNDAPKSSNIIDFAKPAKQSVLNSSFADAVKGVVNAPALDKIFAMATRPAVAHNDYGMSYQVA